VQQYSRNMSSLTIYILDHHPEQINLRRFLNQINQFLLYLPWQLQ
jgi:hypothetical protein